LSGIAGIIKYRKGVIKRLDDLIPNVDLPVLHSFGIVLLVSGIVLDHIGKAMDKKLQMPNLRCFIGTLAIMTLSITTLMIQCHYTEYHYAEHQFLLW